eukprot:5371019-Amphidinium_carterae.1
MNIGKQASKDEMHALILQLVCRMGVLVFNESQHSDTFETRRHWSTDIMACLLRLGDNYNIISPSFRVHWKLHYASEEK